MDAKNEGDVKTSDATKNEDSSAGELNTLTNNKENKNCFYSFFKQ